MPAMQPARPVSAEAVVPFLWHIHSPALIRTGNALLREAFVFLKDPVVRPQSGIDLPGSGGTGRPSPFTNTLVLTQEHAA